MRLLATVGYALRLLAIVGDWEAVGYCLRLFELVRDCRIRIETIVDGLRLFAMVGYCRRLYDMV